MCADSITANKVWSNTLSTYISIICNDIVRFVGDKEINFMPSGEIVCGASAILNNANMYKPIFQVIEEKYEDTNKRIVINHIKHRRVIKIVHPEKRKAPFLESIGNGNNKYCTYISADSYKGNVNTIKKFLGIK